MSRDNEADRHHVSGKGIGGFCIGHESSFERIIGEYASAEVRLAKLKAGLEELGDTENTKPIAAQIEGIENELKLAKAHYGAVAQLWQAGVLEKVLPCEDENLLDVAKPIAEDGAYREDAEAIEAREDFIVRTLLESRPVSYVILGEGGAKRRTAYRAKGGTR